MHAELAMKIEAENAVIDAAKRWRLWSTMPCLHCDDGIEAADCNCFTHLELVNRALSDLGEAVDKLEKGKT